MDSSSQQLSNVSNPQQRIQGLLGDAFGSLLGPGFKGQRNQAFGDLLSGAGQDMTDLTNAAFRDFREFAIPGINAQAAQFSGIQNSRRVGEIARAAGNVTSQLSRTRAGFLEGARGRQMQTLLGILGAGSGFANANTNENLVEGSPFGQALGLAGTLGGAFLGGPAGAAAFGGGDK